MAIISTNNITPITPVSTNMYTGLPGMNVIRNVYNLGGTSACDAGTQYCQEGYGLYVPCLKDITKGQDVCIEFYVVDNSTKDVTDLRDVDAISLDLSGAFGCSFGTFSYPDNVKSLQWENTKLLYSNEFGNRNKFKFTIYAIDVNGESDYFDYIYAEAYEGSEITSQAKDYKYGDTEYEFLGWIIPGQYDDDCEDDTLEDHIVSDKNIYKTILDRDTEIIALYRKKHVIEEGGGISINSISYSCNDEVMSICNSSFADTDYDNKYLHLYDGNHITIKPLDEITDEMYIVLDIPEANCEIIAKSNNNVIDSAITEAGQYGFLFKNYDKSDVEINILNGECLINKIEIYDIEIIDKGKAELCLDSETTSNLPSGNLNISGAISVNGNVYGIPSVQIGSVNKLNKIQIQK